MPTNLKKARKGFTLIELLIVIAIIGGLASIVTFTFPAAQERARDAQRRSDLKQYQTAIEAYANNHNGLYPASVTSITGLCTAIGQDNCVLDPRDGLPDCHGGANCGYLFFSTRTQYVIAALLERPNETGDPYFVVCSDGRSGAGDAPTDENCSLP